ncbi:hypothetical protein EBQ74_04500 [bacterium]|nr:hypothetical protein [bacterium]
MRISQSVIGKREYVKTTSSNNSLCFERGKKFNPLEILRAEWKRFHSIRINNQKRLVFRWEDGNAYEVQFIDYQ